MRAPRQVSIGRHTYIGRYLCAAGTGRFACRWEGGADGRLSCYLVDGMGGEDGRKWATSEASSTLDCQRCRYRSKRETDVTGGSQEARKPGSLDRRKGGERGGHLINDPPSVVGSHKESPGELGDQRGRAAGPFLSLIELFVAADVYL
jgi:hypothetical protein